MAALLVAVGAGLGLLASAREARAQYPEPYGAPPPTSGGYSRGRSGGRNGWGLVPGYRYGLVRGSFDGATTTGGAEAQTTWGRSSEFHLDFLQTFARDRHAYGVSLGYLSQSSDRGAGHFENAGLCATGILSTVLGGRNSVALRAGVVSGPTSTAGGDISATMLRGGGELTHVFSIYFMDIGAHFAVEYFRAAEGGRTYQATALVLGLTASVAAF